MSRPKPARPSALAIVLVPFEWVWVECDLPGSEALRFEVAGNLSPAALDRVRARTVAGEGREALAPLVRAWNVGLPHPVTGEPVPLPPPAEAGPDVLRELDGALYNWLALAPFRLSLARIRARVADELTRVRTENVAARRDVATARETIALARGDIPPVA